MANNEVETPADNKSKETILAERGDLVKRLIDKLQSDRFVAVNGPVGSGKSTLVYTLLVRELKNFEGRAGKDWRVVYTKPGVNPLGNLAEALAKPIAKPIADASAEPSKGVESVTFGLFKEGSASINAVSTTIFPQVTAKKNSQGIFTPVESSALTTIYEAALLDQKKIFNLLIIVDQAHDLFRYQPLWNTLDPKGAGAGDDAIFFNLLLSAKRSTAPIYVIMVADSRHSNHFYKYPGLPEAINNSGFYVPPISKTQELKNYLDKKISSKNPSNKEKTKEFEPLFDELILDYQKLYQNDPSVIMNLNMVVDLLAQEPGPDYLQAYKSRIQAEGFEENDPPLKRVIAYNLESNVFPKLKTQNGPDEEVLKRIFQALTNLEGNSTYNRRPIRMKTLLEIANRPALIPEDPTTPNKTQVALTREAIVATLLAFNTLEEHFVLLPDKEDEIIVDINSEALLNSWPKLRNWIHEEWVHGQVYQNLVRDAIPYFISQSLVEQPDDPNAPDALNQTGVYNGAAFLSAKNWIEICRPNTHWALRYLSEPPKEFEQIKKRIPGIKKDGSANFTIAKKFYEESVKKFDDAINQKKGELQIAKKKKNRAYIITGLATLAFGLAFVFGLQTKSEKNKKNLANFVNSLNYYWALNVPNDLNDTTDIVGGVIDSINEPTRLFKQPKIQKTEDGLLNYLAKIKLINVDTQNKALKNLYYAALKTLNETDENVAGDSLANQYKRLESFNKKDLTWRQHPSFYYAMYTKYWEKKLEEDTKVTDTIKSTIIESGALATINQRVCYGFGDHNGKIYLYSPENRLIDTPNVGGVIKSLAYNSADTSLYIGTESGKIFNYNIKYLNNGQSQKKQKDWNKLVYSDEGKPVYFLGAWPKDPNLVLVGTTSHAYFLKRSPISKFTLFGPKKIELEPKSRITCRVWSPEHQLLLIGGKDSVVIYHLDPADKEPIKMVACIKSNEPVTITSIAIRAEPRFSDPNWSSFNFSMGDEKGFVWIGGLKLPKKRPGAKTAIIQKTFKEFDRSKGAESMITCMAFNPVSPQLVVGSLDGTLRFWNIGIPKDRKKANYYYDDIYFRYNTVVNAITFINQDEIAVHCGVFDFKEATNISKMGELLFPKTNKANKLNHVE